MIGEVIGNYRVTAKLGAGGMGEVYRAEHVLIGRSAALKVLLPELSSNKNVVSRFFNEAKAASAIRHPGIVEILDFGYHGDSSAYILMEFLEGESLQDRLRRLGSLSLDMTLALTRQIAGALAAAHEQDIVHRDLKPDNIFIVPDPEVASGERIKLLDFGIAKLAGDNVSGLKTRTGMVMGTPAYMAPEQCKGAGQVDSRADLYSLGCIVFRMVCGRRVFTAKGGGEVLAQHIFAEPPAPTSIVPALHPEVDGFVLGLLAKEPAMRPQSARDVIAQLDALYHRVIGGRLATSPAFGGVSAVGATPVQTTISAGAGAVAAPVPRQESGPHRPGRQWLVRGAAALAVALVAVGGYMVLGGEEGGAAGEPASAAEVAEEIAEDVDAGAAAVAEVIEEDAAGEPEAVEPAVVTVVIESEPGADVYRGEERVGATPYRVELVDGAEHTYVLQREGYADATVHVPADADEDGKVAVELEKQRAVRASRERTGDTRSKQTSKKARKSGKRRKRSKGGVLKKGGSLPF